MLANYPDGDLDLDTPINNKNQTCTWSLLVCLYYALLDTAGFLQQIGCEAGC